MTPPIFRGDDWWERAEDGSWLVWDEDRSEWISSPFAPPPPAPPPSVWTNEADLATGALARLRSSRFLAVALVLTMAAGVGAYSLSRFLFQEAANAPFAEPPAPGAANAASAPDCLSDVRPVPVDDADGDLTRHVGQIARAVEQLRDLDFRSIPRPIFRSPQEVKRTITRDVRRNYTKSNADEDRRVLTLLGAIEPGTNLRALLTRATSEQIAGFYVPRTKKLVVEATDTERELSAFAELILAHELEHALADQVLGLGLAEDPAPSALDAASARRALIEGDATFTMQRYAQASLGFGDQFSLGSDPTLQQAGAGMEGLSHFLRRALAFPYDEGLRFVCHLYARGGWAEVDRAYRKGPTTTLEILFPERYLEGPRSPEATTSLGLLTGDWRRVQRGAVGAADLLFLFEAPAGDAELALDDPRAAAGAWAGGALELWIRGGQSALGITLRMTPETDLCGSIEDWYRRSFPLSRERSLRPGERFALDAPRQDAVLRCAEGAVGFGIAPTLEEARALVSGEPAAS